MTKIQKYNFQETLPYELEVYAERAYRKKGLQALKQGADLDIALLFRDLGIKNT